MENIISLSKKAIGQVENIISKEKNLNNKGLRIGVVGGGCSGLSYKIELSEFREKDFVIEQSKFKIFIDPKSSIYLKGIELDFEDGLNGKGFVFKNPNATNTCGCGESFSV